MCACLSHIETSFKWLFLRCQRLGYDYNFVFTNTKAWPDIYRLNRFSNQSAARMQNYLCHVKPEHASSHKDMHLYTSFPVYYDAAPICNKPDRTFMPPLQVTGKSKNRTRSEPSLFTAYSFHGDDDDDDGLVENKRKRPFNIDPHRATLVKNNRVPYLGAKGGPDGPNFAKYRDGDFNERAKSAIHSLRGTKSCEKLVEMLGNVRIINGFQNLQLQSRTNNVMRA